ncbi:primase C-terminal domain-containing protein [Carboxydothermus ferrireducens]|uniref:DNA-binding Lrp family transcriptional regulator n=1 Tax=Carboxydothermus ferrireducens DSM 11255 TaxID=1119529 RepID=A0ABX2R885_9THEO|nr:primase C-terminal domain-containing protein [Carboxydothermus ferrireducens]NYE57110.1 DNA-binding Lrp family transcriptional regulator [Carboxydothermus ferrireducens DSM 11255]
MGYKLLEPAEAVLKLIEENIKQGKWTFFGETENDEFVDEVPVKKLDTILKKISDKRYTYFTPNGFSQQRFGKTKNNVELLNSISLDIDEAVDFWEIINALEAEGLPEATLIVPTPHGWHLHWKIEAVKAKKSNQNAYLRAMSYIRIALNKYFFVDPQAISTERYFRIPRQPAFYSGKTYTLDFFTEWANKVEAEMGIDYLNQFTVAVKNGRVTIVGELLNDPAVQKLLEGVPFGIRNRSCYSLALVFKAAGFSFKEALEELLRWNKRNSPPLSEKEVRKAVSSAYRSNKMPSARWLYTLTGIAPKFRVVVKTAPRRKNADEAILNAIKENGGSLEADYDSLAKTLGLSRSTVIRHIQKLEEEGKIQKETIRQGRKGCVTRLILNEVNIGTEEQKTRKTKTALKVQKVAVSSKTTVKQKITPPRTSKQLPNLNSIKSYNTMVLGVGGGGSAGQAGRRPCIIPQEYLKSYISLRWGGGEIILLGAVYLLERVRGSKREAKKGTAVGIPAVGVRVPLERKPESKEAVGLLCFACGDFLNDRFPPVRKAFASWRSPPSKKCFGRVNQENDREEAKKWAI